MIDIRHKLRKELSGLKENSILEIGALNRPIAEQKLVHDSSQIFYLDHLATENLRGKYKSDDSVNVEEIVKVDFVCSDGDIPKAVINQKFDRIIASHVIEHVPNPINWIKDLASILKPNGVLHLFIPDKRFTFDCKRSLTTFGEMLEWYLTDRKYPSIQAVYDHFSTAVIVDGGAVWNGVVREIDLVHLFGTKLALDYAQKVDLEETYFDVHVSTFTPFSFFDLFRQSIEAKLMQIEVIEFVDTQIGQIEFFVSLRNLQTPENIELTNACLRSIPKIVLEGIFSPYMPQVRQLSEAVNTLSKTQTELLSEIDRLRASIDDQASSLEVKQEQLDLANGTISRRSVRLTLKMVAFLFKFIPSLKKGRE